MKQIDRQFLISELMSLGVDVIFGLIFQSWLMFGVCGLATTTVLLAYWYGKLVFFISAGVSLMLACTVIPLADSQPSSWQALWLVAYGVFCFLVSRVYQRWTNKKAGQ